MDAADALWKELRTMNSNIPVGRRTLAEHMDSGDYSYKMRGGETVTMTDEEVRMIRGACGLREMMSLRLPIFIGTDVSGDGAWSVDGRAEAKVISEILGKPRFKEDRVRFHNPDLRRLMNVLPNAVFVIFTP